MRADGSVEFCQTTDKKFAAVSTGVQILSPGALASLADLFVKLAKVNLRVQFSLYAVVIPGAHKYRVEGNPDPKYISRSFVERSNLSIRMSNRRKTRLTNAFLKKAENPAHMMAIYFMHYNFMCVHQTLKITPAMAACITSKLLGMTDMVKVLEDWESLKVAGA